MIIFQRKFDRSIDYLKEKNPDEVKPLSDELLGQKLEKNDARAMAISAMITILPVALIVLVALERPALPLRDAAIAVIPTLIYAIIALILNLARRMDGPYPFLRVYRQPVSASAFWFAAILGGNYLIALAVRAMAKGSK